MIISIDVGLGGGRYDKIQHLFMILKNQLRKITIERNFLHLIKGKAPSVNILLNDKRMNVFPLSLRTR